MLVEFRFRYIIVSLCFYAGVTIPLSSWAKGETVLVCDDVSDPLTLDPQKQFTEKNHTILQQIFEGLVRFDPDGKIIPALAEKWERLNPLTVRFYLRQGIKFHNGEPFDAQAVQFTVSRYLDPKISYPAVGFISSIASSTIVAPNIIDIHTHFPDGVLINRLASLVLIVPPIFTQSMGEVGLSESPVGTGPFIFSKWDKGHEIELKANDQYWRKGFPKIKTLIFRFISVEEQLPALFKGEIDLLTEMPGTMTLRAKENERTDVIKKDSFYTVAGIFNTSRKPLSDKKVRQAINLAINREEIVRYDLLGNGIVLATLTMPGESGHNSDLKPYPFDVEKAKKLLQKAGFPNGFRLKTMVRIQGKRTAGILAKQLERINIILDLVVIQSDSDVIPAFKREDWDMGIAGVPDPMAHSFFIQSILLFSQSPYSLNHSSDYDQRLLSMASELDISKQESMGRALDKFIYDEALCLPTYQRIKTYGVSRRIRFTPYVTGMPYFDSISVNQKDK